MKEESQSQVNKNMGQITKIHKRLQKYTAKQKDAQWSKLSCYVHLCPGVFIQTKLKAQMKWDYYLVLFSEDTFRVT